MKNGKKERNGTRRVHSRHQPELQTNPLTPHPGPLPVEGRGRIGSPVNGNGHRPVLITGGAGFIGTNVAHGLLTSGKDVILYDNLSRPGVEHNLRWLCETHGSRVHFEAGDVLDFESLRRVVGRASAVFHFAAQVAVTTSLDDPIGDFEINARGTLNLLEALRRFNPSASLLFTSTNKVYGDLKDVPLQIRNQRYEPAEAEIRRNGFSEERPLAFHSPYGCSKGAACQYVSDYARTFGLRTAIFRMSCIYGLHQFGTEDQGWVAHFVIRALNKLPITIYGDGRQVRDVLFVEDLVGAMLRAQERIDDLAGQAFNIGGGPENTVSLLELVQLIAELQEVRPEISFEQWRPADQRYYVSDIRKFSAATGWRPTVGVREGVPRLYEWLQEFQRAVPTGVLKPAEGNGHSKRFPVAPNGAPRKNGVRVKHFARNNRVKSLLRKMVKTT